MTGLRETAPVVDEPDEDDEYRGEAVVFTAEQEVPVEVVLRGHFQPIDGRYRWYGRVAANAGVDRLTGGRKTQVVLRTPHGDAAATLSEPDPWNRYRITGTGRPPYELPANAGTGDAGAD